jgi:hypothetical protein
MAQGIPKIRGLKWGGNSEPEPHILGMSPAFDFTNCKAQGKNYHEHNIAGQKKKKI